MTSFIRARPTRSPSRSDISSGSGSPVVQIAASPSIAASSIFSHSGEWVSASSGAELDHRVPDMVVAVAHVDVARAGAVGGPGQCPPERRVLDESVEEDRLPFLHVRADANGEVGVRLEPFVGHRSYSCHTSSRRIGTAVPSLVMPSTATSGPPIMKSVCTVETLIPRARSSSGDRPSSPSTPNVTAAP